MKTHALFLLAFTVIVGCSWTPQRDNTADPKSQFFIPQANMPRIDSVWMTTECHTNNMSGTFCEISVLCKIYDPNRVIRLDSIFVKVDTLPIGRMNFNPDFGSFFIRYPQDSAPGGTFDPLIGKLIRVSIVDTLGRHDSSSVEFHRPVDRPAANIVHPRGDIYPDSVFTYYPRLGWGFWGGPVGTHTFSISVKYMDILQVWDTTGLAPADTFVVVSDSLRDSGLAHEIYYSWYLTVTNERGDQVVSQPGFFRIWPSHVPPYEPSTQPGNSQ